MKPVSTQRQGKCRQLLAVVGKSGRTAVMIKYLGVKRREKNRKRIWRVTLLSQLNLNANDAMVALITVPWDLPEHFCLRLVNVIRKFTSAFV